MLAENVDLPLQIDNQACDSLIVALTPLFITLLEVAIVSNLFCEQLHCNDWVMCSRCIMIRLITHDPHLSGLVRWEYVNWHTGQTPIFKKFSGLYLKYYNSTRPQSGRDSGFLMPSFIKILMFRASNLCRLTVPHLACLWFFPVKNPDFELAIDWDICMIQTQLHYCHEAELSHDNVALKSVLICRYSISPHILIVPRLCKHH